MRAMMVDSEQTESRHILLENLNGLFREQTDESPRQATQPSLLKYLLRIAPEVCDC